MQVTGINQFKSGRNDFIIRRFRSNLEARLSGEIRRVAKGLPAGPTSDWRPPGAALRNPTHARHRRRQQLGFLAHGTVRSGLQTPIWRATVGDAAPHPEGFTALRLYGFTALRLYGKCNRLS